MIETWMLGLLLAITAVFWLVPKTRKAGGNMITAWKCVPVGCSVMILLPQLLFGMFQLLTHYCGFSARRTILLAVLWSFLALGVVAGVAVAAKLRNYCRKHCPSDQPFSNSPFYRVFISLLIVIPVIAVVGSVITVSMMFRSGGYRGSWRTYPVIHVSGTELAFQECSIHPFLAEYDYRFRFRKDSGAETYQDLWCNTGGQTHFNIFRLKNGRFFFSDKDQDYLVDVKERKVFMVVRFERHFYAAQLPPGPFRSFSGVTPEKERYYVWIGNHRVEAHPVTDQLADRKYFGCITTGFYPATEKPYMPVTKSR